MEDILYQGKTLYFWKDGNFHQDLRDGKYGKAGYELQKNGKGVNSNEAFQEGIKTDAGILISILRHTCLGYSDYLGR